MIVSSLTFALLLAVPPAGQGATKDCSKDTFGTLPLNDLGSGAYLGWQGGLYPGGQNERPLQHDTAGRWIAENLVVPRDASGNPSEAGVVGFVSIGLSNTTQEFTTFLGLLAGEEDLDPALRVVDCAKGGVGLESAVDPADPKGYWPFVSQRLQAAELDPDQVQVAWLKTAYGSPPSLAFPSWQQQQAVDLTTLVRLLKQRFPNLVLCFVSSRIYGHYSQNPNREEPTAYESGFGFKWLIERQIQGQPSLSYDPLLGSPVAPWLSWGPYLWADGVVPRSDGLQWLCPDFVDDGAHPSVLGRQKVAAMLLAFFRGDPATRPWFLDDPGPRTASRPRGSYRAASR